jgi:SAM-dependent methyltransferase
MVSEDTLELVCRALRSPAAVGFVRETVRTGYHEIYTAHVPEADRLVEQAFNALVQSQEAGVNAAALSHVTGQLITETFRKGEGRFWFNSLYHQYKTVTKPETDLTQLRELLVGKRVLDYGCGSGYLAEKLARNGYEVFTTDVLDYRYEEARHLPFVQMTSPTDLAYPDDSIDTALVQAVLHHIDPPDLPGALGRLARISRLLLVKEDAYDLPAGLPGLEEVLVRQPLLRDFVQLSPGTQFAALILIDYYANAVAQGIPEMNMPFAFKTRADWQRVLMTSGWNVIRTVLAGFEPGRMHKSCHIWLLCERAP